MAKKVRLVCKECGKVSKLDAAKAGKKIKCSVCGVINLAPKDARPEKAPNQKATPYIRKSLLRDETVVYQAKIHWVVLINAFFITFLCIPFCVLFPPLVLLPLIVLTKSFILYWCSEYAITNKRVIGKKGFLLRESIELYHKKIEAVEVKQGLMDRVIDIGIVVITGSGGSESKLEGISNPEKFKKALNEQIHGDG